VSAAKLQRTVEVTNAKELATQADHEFLLQYKAGSKVLTRRGRSVLAPYEREGQAAKIVNWSNANYARSRSDIGEQYERWLGSAHYGGGVQPVAVLDRTKVEKKRSGRMRSVGTLLADGQTKTALLKAAPQ